MNERIRELYQQAHMVREYPADDPWRGGNPATVYWGGERSAEKFAELIVRECVDRGNDLAKHYIDKHSEKEQAHLLAAIADYSNEIRKHFGVE